MRHNCPRPRWTSVTLLAVLCIRVNVYERSVPSLLKRVFNPIYVFDSITYYPLKVVDPMQVFNSTTKCSLEVLDYIQVLKSKSNSYWKIGKVSDPVRIFDSIQVFDPIQVLILYKCFILNNSLVLFKLNL